MTLIGGDANYTITLSTDYTGSAGSESPSGDTVKFFAQDVEYKPTSGDQRKILSNGSSLKVITGKISRSVGLMNCIVVANVENTATEEMDAIEEFVHAHGEKVGSTKVYLWIYHESDARYKKLGYDSSNNHTRYLKGFPLPLDYKMGAGKTYIMPTFLFEEVTI